MDLIVGKTYPILFDGAPATEWTTIWTVSDPGLNVQFVSGAWVAHAVAAAASITADATLGGRTGSVTVNTTAEPIIITFGDPL